MSVKNGKLFDSRSAGKRKGNSSVAEQQQKTKHEDGHGTVSLPDVPPSSPPLQFP